MSVITSVVEQNTTGVQDVHHLPLEMIDEQLTSVFQDMPVHAMKTGMIANIEMMKVIQKHLEDKDITLVIDPVMVATRDDSLINEEARDYLRTYFLPLSTLVTRNIPETQFLTGIKIEKLDNIHDAAKMINHH